MIRLVLFGPPTAGKSTLAYRLAHALGLRQVGVGDSLRQAAKTDARLAGRLGDGRPVDDETVAAAVQASLTAREGYVLEGFPRSLAQLARFEAWPTAGGARLIALDLDLSSVAARFLARGVCDACRRAEYDPGPCALCGGPLTRRADATPQALAAKLQAYRQGEAPLIAHLAAAGRLELHPVRGEAEADFLSLMRRILAPPLAQVPESHVHEP